MIFTKDINTWCSAVLLLIFLFYSTLAYSVEIELISCPDQSLRQKIGSDSSVDFNGKKIEYNIFNFIQKTVEDVTLQEFSESAQLLDKKFRQLTQDWNNCLLDKSEYKKRIDFLIGYSKNYQLIPDMIAKIEELEQAKDSENIEQIDIEQIDIEQKNILERLDKKVQAMDLLLKDQIKSMARYTDETSRDIAYPTDLLTKGEVIDILGAFNVRITSRYEKRLLELEKKFNVLLAQHEQGGLKKATIILGFSVGTYRIDSENYIGYILNGEILYPALPDFLKGLSINMEVGGLDWEKDVPYMTLENISEGNIHEKNSLIHIGGGLKKYFKVSTELATYISGIVGGSKERAENSEFRSYFNVGAGVSYYPGRIKTSIEYRYGKFKFQEEDFQFNSFGAAKPVYTERKKSARALMISFSYSL